MKVHLANNRFDCIPDLSREFVNAQTDGDMLAGWYDVMAEKAAELTEFVRARELCGVDADATAGRLAFTKIANRWIEARLITLGHHVPYPPSNPLKREIANNQKRITRLKQQVRALGGDPDESLSPARATGDA